MGLEASRCFWGISDSGGSAGNEWAVVSVVSLQSPLACCPPHAEICVCPRHTAGFESPAPPPAAPEGQSGDKEGGQSGSGYPWLPSLPPPRPKLPVALLHLRVWSQGAAGVSQEPDPDPKGSRCGYPEKSHRPSERGGTLCSCLP